MLTTKYIVLESDNSDALCEKINAHLGRGWTLVGGVSIANIGPKLMTLPPITYAQAMTLTTAEDSHGAYGERY